MKYIAWNFLFILIGSLLNVSTGLASSSTPAIFSLRGTLYATPNGFDPLYDPAVQFKIQILDDSRSCILYEEQQTAPTSPQGDFHLTVGKNAHRTAADPGNALPLIFQNIISIPAPGSCGVLPPMSLKERYLRLYVRPSSTGITDVMNLDLAIGSVPNALVADTVQGLSRSQILELERIPELTQANLEDLVKGTSTHYMRQSSDGLRLSNLNTTPSTLEAGKLWFDTSGVLKMYDGTSVRNVFSDNTAVTTSAGTAASPALSFTDDPDTGWYRAAENVLAASTGGTEKIRLTPEGHLGLGTTTPGYDPTAGKKYLTIAGDTQSGTIQMVALNPTDTTNSVRGSVMAMDLVSGTPRALGAINIATSGATAGNRGGAMTFYVKPDNATGMNAVLLLSDTARAGINTPPSTSLDVLGLTTLGTQTHTTARFRVRNATNLDAGLVIGVNAGTLPYIADDTTSTVANGFDLRTSGVSRMRFLGNGNIGVGVAAPGVKFEVAGVMKNTNGALQCTYDPGTAPACSSDRRLKENITPIPLALNKVLQVHGVSFEWNELSGVKGKKALGLIAQDVEAVFPDLVKTDPSTGYRMVEYSGMVAPIIEALRELFNSQTKAQQEQALLQERILKLEKTQELLLEKIKALETK